VSASLADQASDQPPIGGVLSLSGELGSAPSDSDTLLAKDTVTVPAHLPLSGRIMAFDGGGRSVTGC